MITFSSGGIGVSANITGVASLSAHFAAKIQMRVDAIRAMSNNTAGVWNVDAGSGVDPKLELWISNDSSGNTIWELEAHGIDHITTASTALTAFPANGNDIIIYTEWNALSQILTIFDTSGNVIVTVNSSANRGNLSTTGGANGVVTLNDAIDATLSLASSYGGFAIYSAGLTGSAQWSAPSSSDSNIVAMWKMNDATSGTTPTSIAASVGSQALALSGTYVWANDGATGTWFGVPTTTVVITGIKSTTSIGTVSTTGSTQTTTTGGRVLFTAGTGFGFTDIPNSAIQPLTAIGVKMKFDPGALASLPANSTMALWAIDDNQAGTGTNCKCRGYASTDASGNLSFTFSIPGAGAQTSSTITAANLPASGIDVILFMGYDHTQSTSQVIALYDALGNSILSSTGTQNLGPLPVITNNGFLHVNLANHPTVTPTAPAQQAMNIDGIAFYSGLLSGGAQWATPSTQDATIEAFFRFDEQTGTFTSDDLLGPRLGLSNFAWLAGGSWLASNHVTVVVAGIQSATTVGVAAPPAFSNAAVQPIAGVPSATIVTGVNEVDCTVYIVGLNSATTLNPPTFFSGNGIAIPFGIPSTTTIGTVKVVIQNAIILPTGGPPISGIVGVQPLPPATLQYIAQMAALFSTANVDATGAVALPDPTVICQRVASDQAGIFAKIAERNRSFYLRIAPVVTSNASSGRVIDLTQLAAPVQRPLQLNLADGRTANFVDLLDTAGELAPRCYIFRTNIVEVNSEFSATPGPVQGLFWYVQGPTPLKLNGDLTQSVTLPGDWSDLLILPLAAWIAATDIGRPPDEPTRIMELYQSRLGLYLEHLEHYAGVGAMRFDIPRPLSTAR